MANAASDEIVYVPCLQLGGSIKVAPESAKRMEKYKNRRNKPKPGPIGRLFHLPGPKELGRAEYDALPMNRGDESGAYSWDDWRDEVKRLHPVRYLIVQTLWLRLIRRYAFRLWRAVQTTFYRALAIALRRQPHLVNLKRATPVRGDLDYMSPGHGMLIAAFAMLCRYKNQGRYVDPRLLYKPEDIEGSKDIAKAVAEYDEIEALHRWWTVDRVEACARLNLLKDASFEAFKRKDARQTRGELYERQRKLEKEIREKEQVMLLRLVNVRNALWL